MHLFTKSVTEFIIEINESKNVKFDLEKLGHLGAARRLMIGWGGTEGSISVQNVGHCTTNILFYINKLESVSLKTTFCCDPGRGGGGGYSLEFLLWMFSS